MLVFGKVTLEGMTYDGWNPLAVVKMMWSLESSPWVQFFWPDLDWGITRGRVAACSSLGGMIVGGTFSRKGMKKKVSSILNGLDVSNNKSTNQVTCLSHNMTDGRMHLHQNVFSGDVRHSSSKTAAPVQMVIQNPLSPPRALPIHYFTGSGRNHGVTTLSPAGGLENQIVLVDAFGRQQVCGGEVKRNLLTLMN